MQEKHLFEYAIIRVVPRVEREEFINVGVVLYCAKEKFLKAMIEIDRPRLLALAPAIDLDEVGLHLDSFRRICEGGKNGGPIGLFDLPSRFRWLTATRSTIIQASKVHPGLCKTAEDTLKNLFVEFVQ